MDEPTVAGTITMHMGETWVDVHDPPLTAGVYVMDVIRGSGMREGDRMGWGVVTVVDNDGPDDGLDVSIFPAWADAVGEWRRRRDAGPRGPLGNRL